MGVDSAYMNRLRDMVWAFRREMEDVWPTPDTLDSLRFAFTEAGEAMDAWLRQKGGYARNHQKDADVLSELAQCAMMLITALGQDYRFDEDYLVFYGDSHLDCICGNVAQALLRHIEGWPGWKTSSHAALARIAITPDMDLEEQLAKQFVKLRRKHKGE